MASAGRGACVAGSMRVVMMCVVLWWWWSRWWWCFCPCSLLASVVPMSATYSRRSTGSQGGRKKKKKKKKKLKPTSPTNGSIHLVSNAR